MRVFTVFINDLPEGVLQPITVDIFADNKTFSLSSPYTDTSGLCSKLCESTRDLENWSRNNRFKLDTEKTKSMFVTGTKQRTKIGGTSVNESYLESMMIKTSALMNKLNHYVRNRQNVIRLLRSIRQYLPLNERILFYNTTVKPVFLYDGQSGVQHQSIILDEFFVFRKEQLMLF